MKKFALPVIAVVIFVALAYWVFAGEARAQTPPAPVVNFSISANMPTLKDSAAKDTFEVVISDAQVSTTLDSSCTAGRTTMVFMRSDKACSISGAGSIIAPNGQALPRTQYAGGYVVTADGTTDAATMSVNYLAVGKVAPSTAAFSGSMNLKPELTSTGAAGLKEAVLKRLNTNAGGALIDQRVDTVDLNRVAIPSAGLPSDKGCIWSGNMVFAYQTESWFMDLSADCGGKVYELTGNMPWTDSPGVENQTQYDLTLTLPTADAVGDDALFASTDSNADLFATADGISAQILMAEANHVTVDIDGVQTRTPSRVEATGTFTGTNVPLEAVRSLATLIGLLSSTFVGA